MISEKIIQAINNGIREHYGLAPKFIAMNRKNYDILKNEYIKNNNEYASKTEDIIGLGKGLFFGIPIRIVETDKEFELRFHVDPLDGAKQ